MTQQITINEVGLRDGLQNQPGILSTDQKLEILNSLLSAGLRHLEVTSFVNPRAVPQTADARELYERLPHKDQNDYSALVPNQRGYEIAIDAGARSIAVVLGCTDSMNKKNINRNLADAIEECKRIVATAKQGGITGRAYLAVAFLCPYEGRVDPRIVIDLASQLREAGASEIILADTIGAANPVQVAQLFRELIVDHGSKALSAHFHDTRGLGLANCYAALEQGVTKFDSSIGGLGGCPFAPGSSGNVATEDLIHLCESAGLHTGVSLEALSEAVSLAERHLAQELGGRWLQWRRRSQLALRRSKPGLETRHA